jgi:ribosomal protein L7/L12
MFKQLVRAINRNLRTAREFEGTPQVVEAVRLANVAILQCVLAKENPTTYTGGLTQQEYEAIVIRKNKIEAIKHYRQRSLQGLKEAKDFIEAEMLRLNIGHKNQFGQILIN